MEIEELGELVVNYYFHLLALLSDTIHSLFIWQKSHILPDMYSEKPKNSDLPMYVFWKWMNSYSSRKDSILTFIFFFLDSISLRLGNIPSVYWSNECSIRWYSYWSLIASLIGCFPVMMTVDYRHLVKI